MAALGAEAKDGQKVTLYVRYETAGSDSDEEEEKEAEDSQEFALCTLVAGRIDQQQIALTFSPDEVITLFTRGDAKIHLSGNHVVDEMDQGDMQEMYDEEEGMSGEEEDDEEGEEMTPETLAAFQKALENMGQDDDEEMHSDDFESIASDDEPMSEEIDEELMKQLINQKRKAETQQKKVEQKKPKIEEIKEVKPIKADKKEKKIAVPASTEASPKQLTKKEKKAAANALKETPAPIATPPAEKTEQKSNKKTLPSGLIIEDEIVGKGPMAKKGKKVSMRYIGKLMNGKTFDSNVKGSPFTFKLGGGEVIKGWDLGIEGMNVGGTRKLTIPAALAYGAKGAKPDIPSNAVLQFEVKLLDIKN